MSVKRAGDGVATAVRLTGEVLESYEKLDVSKRQYLGYVLLPALGVFLASVVGLFLLPLPLAARVPVPMFGALALVAAVVYPKIYLSSQENHIDNQLHLVMTHMTVLSTTNIDRMEVFRTLAAEEEYGVAAEEIGRVVHLVDTWNQSLDEACRRRAKEVPSAAMGDFFDRLGYTLGAGQSLETFLFSEQDVMLTQYETLYESSLSNLEVMKDLYMSMILSVTFALVFAIVLPILTGNDPTATVAAVIVLFVFVQMGFYVAIRAMSPYDPIWYHPEERSPGDLKLWASLGVGGALTFGLIGVTAAGMFGYGPGLPGLLWFIDDVRLPLYLAVPITPMAITGVILRAEEEAITARDAEFPSFIRALGATESAKQSTTTDVLTTLRDKDFGALSPAIERLYRRLNMRISTEGAWRAFSRDTRSYLIQKFSEMYLVGRRMGGEPKQLGELVSRNMNAANQLREQRRQAAVTFVGLIYGITVAATFAFFIGLEIVSILADLSADFEMERMDIGQIIYAGAYDIPLIEYLLLTVVIFNAALSSQMIRTIDGGNPANGYIHFVLLTWLGALTAIATRTLVNALLTI
ncbi:archaellar assembly protein FlaJ [Halorubrum sp. JWXQ-INN 858]|uniref:archaellar assembly protein FlaJ n=1 Tax=Halorubrum sp. JWXQ-INN 858 TaxID=2690782 RepID=UPI001358F93B|nr:archaellar assembly protein FlaJ [Halorubrum sp. JWXQ-INN 858]MWV63689.1 archaellar assembly protein FlaJ [Halorubrum sp. JWXQ-INN 858]